MCVYCSTAAAITGDHVFAREFFLEADRTNLPQVPSCRKCNDEKSRLEHYLTTVLPFGGRHSQARQNLDLMVPKRLRKNQKLHRKLLAGHTETSVPLDGEKVEAMFRLIARGLVWYHWKVYINDETHSVRADMMPEDGTRMTNDPAFGGKVGNRVSGNIGNASFEYEGVQAVDDPASTLWRFSIYGGLVMGGGRTPSSQMSALTAPRQMASDLIMMKNLGGEGL